MEFSQTKENDNHRCAMSKTSCLEGHQSCDTSPGQWKLWDGCCLGNINHYEIVLTRFAHVKQWETIWQAMGKTNMQINTQIIDEYHFQLMV